MQGLVLRHLDEENIFNIREKKDIMASNADESGSSSNDGSRGENSNIGSKSKNKMLDRNEHLIHLKEHVTWLTEKLQQLESDEISPYDPELFNYSEEEDEESAAELQDATACDDSNMECGDYCPTSGPLADKKVPEDGNPEDRAKLTLPEAFSLSLSSIPNIALGVWTQRDIPKGIVFGPYEGEKVYDFDKACQSGYAWLITENGKPHHYIDAQDPCKSNWMRYINCANSERFQNLMVFQYKADIYYRTYKLVEKHTELLVWYGDEYAQEIGVDLVEGGADEKTEKYSQFQCKKCGLTFTAEKYLNSHLKRHRDESGLRTHKCNFCSYSTDHNTNLQHHLLTHTGEKPHVCNQCGKRFSRRDSLQTHMLVHSGEKPYQCDFCHKKFNHKGALTVHTRIHSKDKPYVCYVCGRRFSVVNKLRAHQLTHENSKPHKCPYCEYRANYQTGLHYHVISRHTKQYPHHCPTCGKGFIAPSKMQKHMLKEHHTDE